MTFFENLESIVTAIGGSIVKAFELVSKIFYTPATETASAQITFVGYLGLAALAISLLGVGIRTIMKLIKQKA